VQLTYGNGIHPVQPGAKTLREVDLLPNLAYMETLLKVVDYAAGDLDPRDPSHEVPNRLTDLLIDLCLARYYRDMVGQAAAKVGIAPGTTYQGDVYGGLWNTFIEMFPGLDHDEAKRVAYKIAYGHALPIS